MKTIIGIKAFYLSYLFYKQFIFISLIITLLLYFLLSEVQNDSIFHIIIGIKLLLFVLAYLFYTEPKLKQKLTFYRNFGFSKFNLFLNSVLLDILATVLILLILAMF